jgi:hypothetical protein
LHRSQDEVRCHKQRGLPRQEDMRTRSKQVVAAVLALSAAVVGVWAAAMPHSFYRSFPSPGHHWVSVLGPYNEHMTRDVGGLYLALLVISVWSVLRPRSESLRITGAAWVVFSVPHLVFHLGHLDMFDAVDQWGNAVSLAGTLILALLLLLPTSDSRASGPATSERAAPSFARQPNRGKMGERK